jgi:hypothetical protein
MNYDKKGQAALEFLMTYGWAILVVLAAIGALAYFGVLNPSNFLPDQCLGSTGFGCVGKPDIHAGYTQFIMTNGLGVTATFNNTGTNGLVIVHSNTTCPASAVRFCPRGTAVASCLGNGIVLQNGQETVIVVNCPVQTQAVKSTIEFNYTDSQTGFTQVATVQVSGKVKK